MNTSLPSNLYVKEQSSLEKQECVCKEANMRTNTSKFGKLSAI